MGSIPFAVTGVFMKMRTFLQFKIFIHLHQEKGQGGFVNKIITKKCNFNIKVLDINKGDKSIEVILNSNYTN